MLYDALLEHCLLKQGSSVSPVRAEHSLAVACCCLPRGAISVLCCSVDASMHAGPPTACISNSCILPAALLVNVGVCAPVCSLCLSTLLPLSHLRISLYICVAISMWANHLCLIICCIMLDCRCLLSSLVTPNPTRLQSMCYAILCYVVR